MGSSLGVASPYSGSLRDLCVSPRDQSFPPPLTVIITVLARLERDITLELRELGYDIKASQFDKDLRSRQ